MAKFATFIICVLLASTALAASLPSTGHQPLTYYERKEKCLNMSARICNVMPTEGHSTYGKVFFKPKWERNSHGWHQCYVLIHARVYGLSYNKHGFHIHTYGDLSLPDGTSTGGHFTNPAGREVPHGFSSSRRRHWGDLNNLEPNPSGVAEYSRVDRRITLRGITGRGITIHIAEDQGPNAQPTGAAGARVAYCVIGYANPEIM